LVCRAARAAYLAIISQLIGDIVRYCDWVEEVLPGEVDNAIRKHKNAAAAGIPQRRRIEKKDNKKNKQFSLRMGLISNQKKSLKERGT